MTSPRPAKAAPEPIDMDGRYVRLEPIAPRHAADLYAASTGPGVSERYRWLPDPAPHSLAELERWTLAADNPTSRYWAVIDKTTGRCQGRQAYLNIQPAHGVIEIGGIYWGPAMAGTRLATEAFFLFARHAFDDLGYRRFEWKCNERNEPSRRAARRFGFTYEGTFRQHMIVKGESRDTAWFSIVDGEWPALRARLQAWLAPDNFDATGRQAKRLSEV